MTINEFVITLHLLWGMSNYCVEKKKVFLDCFVILHYKKSVIAYQ